MADRRDGSTINLLVTFARSLRRAGVTVPVDNVVQYVRAIEAVENGRSKAAKGDERLGFDIVAEALRSPTQQIVDNAGEDGEVVVAEILENKNPAWGYNAATSEFVDMIKAGIIDPTKVARTALLNAASVSGLALTTDVLLTELKETDEKSNLVAGAVS